jgi:hypothetical protein
LFDFCLLFWFSIPSFLLRVGLAPSHNLQPNNKNKNKKQKDAQKSRFYFLSFHGISSIAGGVIQCFLIKNQRFVRAHSREKSRLDF